MTRPFVCAACRARQLFQGSISVGRRSLRDLSTSIYRKQQEELQSHRAQSRLEGRGPPDTRNAPTVSKGRYSRTDLRPEQLLDQLGPARRSRAGAGTSQRHSRDGLPDHRTLADPGPDRFSEVRYEQAKARVEALRRCIQEEGHVQAWSLLRGLARQCEFEFWKEPTNRHKSLTAKLEARDLRAYLTSNSPLTSSILAFNWDVTWRWLEAVRADTLADSSSTPAPIELIQTLHEARLLRATVWPTILCQMSMGLHELRPSETQQQPAALESAIKQLMCIWRLSLASCLVETPRGRALGSSPAVKKPPDGLPSEKLDWSFLPPLDSLAERQGPSMDTNAKRQPDRVRGMFEEVLGMLLPNSRFVESHEFDYASAALVTLDLLRTTSTRRSDGDVYSYAEHPDYAPFVRLIEALRKASPIPRTPKALLKLLSTSSKDPATLERVRAMAFRLDLHDVPGSSRKPRRETAVSPPLDDKAESLESAQKELPRSDAFGTIEVEETASTVASNLFASPPQDPHVDQFARRQMSRLGRALEKQDLHQVERLKHETYAFAGSRGSDPTALPIELYEALMMTLLSLRSLHEAVEVWNFITKAGYQVTVRTYTVMMRGAQKVRDFTGMEVFWQRMRHAGIQPDVHAWSTRIYGHIKLRRMQSGLQALSDMGKEWYAAAHAKSAQERADPRKRQQNAQNAPRASAADLLARYPGSIDGVPRPNVAILNTAVAALASSTADFEIPKVLTWARSFGIMPDLITYNVLLNISMRHSRFEDALSLLQRMQQQGIEADSTTWTVLLSALFENDVLENLDHAQQQAKILAFIAAMRAAGASAGIDQKGYGLIIDRLLKRYANPRAAAAVLADMAAQGVPPSAHIYTILMSWYFAQQPEPDFAAIETLWKQIATENAGYGAALDGIFYDRMIEGYATHHRQAGIEKALWFLKRTQHEGKKAGWKALEQVSRALAERKDWSRLRTLVDDTRVRLRSARGGSVHHGQRDFWKFVISTRLLTGEGLATAEQVLEKEAPRSRVSPLLDAE